MGTPGALEVRSAVPEDREEEVRLGTDLDQSLGRDPAGIGDGVVPFDYGGGEALKQGSTLLPGHVERAMGAAPLWVPGGGRFHDQGLGFGMVGDPFFPVEETGGPHGAPMFWAIAFPREVRVVTELVPVLGSIESVPVSRFGYSKWERGRGRAWVSPLVRVLGGPFPVLDVEWRVEHRGSQLLDFFGRHACGLPVVQAIQGLADLVGLQVALECVDGEHQSSGESDNPAVGSVGG